MSESAKGTHIQGLYMVLVSIISLAGGYFLRDPIQKTFFPKYANIGGVWKAHGDLVCYCEVSTVRDTFYLSMHGVNGSGTGWLLKGHGKLDNNLGGFSGTLKIGETNAYEIWGHAEMAGSDQLGVTIFFDEGHKLAPNIYAFIRETSSSLDIPKGDKSK